MNDSFTEATDRKSTMGLDHYGRTFHVADRDLKLQLWDTGGRELIFLPIRYGTYSRDKG